MSADLWLVVGLGNPGGEYRQNRHNVGFMVVDQLLEHSTDMAWQSSRRFSAQLAKGSVKQIPMVLLKPQTFMNLSGQSVVAVAHFYDVPPERIVAIHDDADLPLGRLKLKRGGSDGGHRGVRSMAQLLGSADFHRLRCGIGRPEVGNIIDFVLSDFSQQEKDVVLHLVERGMEAVLCLVQQGLKEAMNRFNGPGKSLDPGPQTA